MPWPIRRFVSQRLVGSGGVVVRDVFLQDVPEVALAQHEDVVETVPPEGADDALRDRVRLGGPHRGQHRRDPHRRRPAHEIAAVAAVPVPKEKTRLHAPGRRFANLLPDPGLGRMPGHVPMHQAPAIMADQHEDGAGAERQRLYGEKVRRPNLGRVQAQKGPPTGRGRAVPAIPLHRCRADRMAQHRQLGRDAPHAPGRILRPDPDDQAADDGIDARTTPRSSAALPTPVAPPRRPVPTDHGGGLHQTGHVDATPASAAQSRTRSADPRPPTSGAVPCAPRPPVVAAAPGSLGPSPGVGAPSGATRSERAANRSTSPCLRLEAPAIKAFRQCRSTSETPQVYPRSRGGTGRFGYDDAGQPGLSPLARGNPAYAASIPTLVRSIPARAGEPWQVRRMSRFGRVYPRSRGGTGNTNTEMTDAEGLSPLARGEPARGWSRTPRSWVYPRSRGGTHETRYRVGMALGLSPLARGNRCSHAPDLPSTRSIPARAGEPVGGVAVVDYPKVYPRSRGGTQHSLTLFQNGLGLSPLARGNPDSDRGAIRTDRSIPARAGEPGEEAD